MRVILLFDQLLNNALSIKVTNHAKKRNDIFLVTSVESIFDIIVDRLRLEDALNFVL